MTLSRTLPGSLTIVVLWHERCAEAVGLARGIFTWMQFASEVRDGLGIPVVYKTRPHSENSPFDMDSLETAVFVILIDDNMVADRSWRDYLANIVSGVRDQDGLAMFPVALDETAFRIPNLNNFNYLNLNSPRAPRDGDANELRRFQEVLLRRRLTEFCCQHLLAKLAGHGESAWVKIFLSHAKVDGLAQADRMKTVIEQHGQLRLFFDESDIPIAQSFGSVIGQELDVCLLAVVTNAFVNRPWCREEVRQIRRPRRQEQDNDRVWYRPPVLLAYHLTSGITEQIPDFGNYTAVVLDGKPESYELAVDRLVCEVLLHTNLRLVAGWLETIDDGEATFVTWVPDPISILEMLKAGGDDVSSKICHPGIGLSQGEKEQLEGFFPDLTFETFVDYRKRLLRNEVGL